MLSFAISQDILRAVHPRFGRGHGGLLSARRRAPGSGLEWHHAAAPRCAGRREATSSTMHRCISRCSTSTDITRAARPHHSCVVRRRPRRPPTGPHPPRGLNGERVGGAVSGTARPRGDRRRPELRPDVRDPPRQDQDRPTRCPGAGRGLPTGGLPSRPSALRCPAPCARALDSPRRAGPHPHRVHLA